MKATDSVTIRREHPASEAASRLIGELDAYLAPLYPQESQHGYSIETLVERQVEFFVLYCGGEPAACGGVQHIENLQEPGESYGELKRIFVRPSFRGRGFGKRILQRLEEQAVSRGFWKMRLETGIYQPESVGLYERTGYCKIQPFGEYWDDPLSLFYEKRLDDECNITS